VRGWSRGTALVTGLAQSWQQVLAAEQAAAFGYGTLGPQLSAGAHTALARTCEQAHRDLVDTVTAQLAGLGQPAISGQTGDELPPFTQLPLPAHDDPSAQLLAIRLEESAAAAWRYLFAVIVAADAAAGDQSARVVSLAGLTGSAVRAVQWRRIGAPTDASVPFPGV
jgi:hypothetical protein